MDCREDSSLAFLILYFHLLKTSPCLILCEALYLHGSSSSLWKWMSWLPLGSGRVLFRNVIARHSQFILLSVSFQSHMFSGLKHTLSLPLCYRRRASRVFSVLSFRKEVNLSLWIWKKRGKYRLKTTFALEFCFSEVTEGIAWPWREEWSPVKYFICLDLQFPESAVPFFSYSDLGLECSFCLQKYFDENKYSSLEMHCESSCCLCLLTLLGTFTVCCIFVSLLI